MWKRVEDTPVEPGFVLVLIHPKHDREAHLIELKVLAERAANGTMRYRMIRAEESIGHSYLDTIEDYTITHWKETDG